MATIICKRNKFNVVYSYYDEAGKRHQKWEAFSTMPEAKQRKSEIEYKQQLGSFTIPTCNTLNELRKSMFRSTARRSGRLTVTAQTPG